MRRTLALLLLLTAAAVSRVEAAPHWEADISWTQPAPATQTGYRLERKSPATGTYTSVTSAPIAPGVATFHDVGPYVDGQVVCWRVTALSVAGEVAFDEVCNSAPVQLPGKGTMTIQWQFIPN